MSKAICAAAAASVLAAVIGVSTAAANPLSGAYLCYSKFQRDPGIWPLSSGNTSHSTAGTLMARGYWSPFAEKSVPTGTRIAGGWYLQCNLQPGQQAVAGLLVGQRGDLFANNLKLLAVRRPGYYPQAT
jgi:hypothetical protein